MDIKVIYSSGGKYNKNNQQQIADGETVDDAKKVADALSQKGHTAEVIKITPAKIGGVKKIHADAVFNLVEWSGKDYPLAVKVLKNLESRNIPYTGADSKSYEWCCDKISMKNMFDKFGIPTPIWTFVVPKNTKEEIEEKIIPFSFPLFIKPAYEHCAIGIDATSVIRKRKGASGKIIKLLSAYKEPVIIEEFIKGREFTTTVIKNNRLHMFPPAEVVFKKGNPDKILSFKTKWIEGESGYSSKIVKDKLLAEVLNKISKKIFTKMKCKGYIRVDMRMRGNKINILEVNINPSIQPEDCYGLTVSTQAAGWNFNKLIDEIAKSAVTNLNN